MALDHVNPNSCDPRHEHSTGSAGDANPSEILALLQTKSAGHGVTQQCYSLLTLPVYRGSLLMSAETREDLDQCPTPTAHRRLDEAHRFWHECLEEYQSPEGFRVKLNACIQALRNVTFVLQKEKGLIADFDAWYKPWQDRMRSDVVLRWVVNSRNRIVKEGDLETESAAKATLVYDYFSAANSVSSSLPNNPGNAPEQDTAREINAPPRYRLEQIIKMVLNTGIPTSILRESMLTIERRWIDRALPDYELLDALATAYARLSDVITDAHTQIGLESPVVMHTAEGEVQVHQHPGWHGRLPCMITTRDARTISVLLKDGTVNDHGRSWHIELDTEIQRSAIKSYGDIKPEPGVAWESSLDAIPFVTDVSRRIVEVGEEHGWFIMYFHGGVVGDYQALEALDMAGKRKLAQEAADHVARNGFDSVLMVSEIWTAPLGLDKDGVPINPSVRPDKGEAIGIFAETADGKRQTRMIPFTRKRRIKTTVTFEQPIDAPEDAMHNFFAPMRAVWQTWPSKN